VRDSSGILLHSWGSKAKCWGAKDTADSPTPDDVVFGANL